MAYLDDGQVASLVEPTVHSATRGDFQGDFRNIALLQHVLKDLHEQQLRAGKKLRTLLSCSTHGYQFTSEDQEEWRSLNALITALGRCEERLKQICKDADFALASRLTSFAKEESRAMLEKLHKTLPRELRDLIYPHMIGGHYVGIVPEDLDDVGTTVSVSNSQPTQLSKFNACMHKSGLTTLLEPGVISESVALEILEHWYSNTRFRFSELSHYENFVGRKIPGLEVAGGSLIRHVELYNFFRVRPGAHVLLNLAASLAQLRTIPHIVNMLMILHYETHLCGVGADQSAEVPIDDVAVIFPALRHLIEGNHKVTIKLGNVLKFKVIVGELSAESWKDKVKKHQEVIRQRRSKK